MFGPALKCVASIRHYFRGQKEVVMAYNGMPVAVKGLEYKELLAT